MPLLTAHGRARHSLISVPYIKALIDEPGAKYIVRARRRDPELDGELERMFDRPG